MQDVDREIAALEQRLRELRARRDQGIQPTHEAADAARDEGCFVIEDAGSMELATLPPLAQAIFDALHVQVFVKVEELDPKKGRQYRYLNKAARDILQWNKPAREYYDGDAFAKGTASQEWKVMAASEAETMRAQRRVERKLSWTASTDGGEVWRVNQTREVPIVSARTGLTVGLCAIAQDLSFNASMQVQKWLYGALQHEYGNLAGQVKANLLDLEDYVGDVQALAPDAPCEDMLAEIRNAKSAMAIARGVAELTYRAMCSIGVEERESVRVEAMVAELRDVFSPASIQLDTGGVQVPQWIVPRPYATSGILVELLRNAYKYTVDAKPVRLSARGTEEGVEWEVINYCPRMSGALRLSPIGIDINQPTCDRFGSQVISHLVTHAFRLSSPADAVVFPGAPDKDGWVSVKVRLWSGGV